MTLSPSKLYFQLKLHFPLKYFYGQLKDFPNKLFQSPHPFVDQKL